MLTFFILSTCVTALALACWPLLLIRRFRPVLQVVSGSGCIAAGSTVVGLLAAGLIALPGDELSRAAAHESTSDSSPAAEPSPVEPAKDASVASVDPATSVAPATSEAPTVSVTPAATPAQPEIKLDSPEIAPPAQAEDIKIETLPDGSIVIPAGRPEWVKVAKSDLSDSNIHKIYVASGPYKLSRDAQRALEEAMKRATDDYVADQLHSPLAAKFIPYSLEAIQDRFVKQTYNETITSPSVGPMEQRHALLQFDEGFRNELRQHWAGRIAESRLYQVGLGAGAALLLLGSVFSYFRLDNATRGYYTGRLQFLTAAAILAIVALGAAAAFQFTWL